MPKSRKFKELIKSTRAYYTGKKVPAKYRERYGKVYSKKEAESVAYAIGKKKKWRT